MAYRCESCKTYYCESCMKRVPFDQQYCEECRLSDDSSGDEMDEPTSNAINAMMNFLDFNDKRADWSKQTFGSIESRGPIGPLKHLRKEAKEAYEESDPVKQREEIADCMFLVLDAAMRANMTFRDLVDECVKKLEKNKKRQWPTPTSSTEPVEHSGGE